MGNKKLPKVAVWDSTIQKWYITIQNGIRTGVKLSFGTLIQRKEITLYMNLKMMLEANNIKTQIKTNNSKKEASEIIKEADPATVYLECYGNPQ